MCFQTTELMKTTITRTYPAQVQLKLYTLVWCKETFQTTASIRSFKEVPILHSYTHLSVARHFRTKKKNKKFSSKAIKLYFYNKHTYRIFGEY